MRGFADRELSTNTGRRIGAFMRVIVSGFILMLSSCTAPPQSFVTDVNSLAWRFPATVTVPNMDTLTSRTLHIIVRSNETLCGDTLTLRIATLSPDSVCFEESFRIRIPNGPQAAPLHRETDIPYRRHVVLADSGIYRFTFTPIRPVRGIEAVGIHIKSDRNGKR